MSNLVILEILLGDEFNLYLTNEDKGSREGETFNWRTRSSSLVLFPGCGGATHVSCLGQE